MMEELLTIKQFIKWLKQLKMDDAYVFSTKRIAFKDGYLNGDHQYYILNGTPAKLKNVKNLNCLILEIEDK